MLAREELGSVIAITNAAGNRAEHRVYKPFGEIAVEDVSAPITTETKGFIGERFDAGAGLQYLNARYYDPELGLFLQPDWFEVTMAGVGTNRFSYSFNDPVNLRDPSGNEIGMGTAFSAYSIASSLSDQPGLTEAEIFSASMNALSGPGWLQALQAAPLLPFVTAEYSLATALGAYKVNKMKKNAGKLQFAQGQANIIKIAARNEYSERGGTGNHDVEGGIIGAVLEEAMSGSFVQKDGVDIYHGQKLYDSIIKPLRQQRKRVNKRGSPLTKKQKQILNEQIDAALKLAEEAMDKYNKSPNVPDDKKPTTKK